MTTNSTTLMQRDSRIVSISVEQNDKYSVNVYDVDSNNLPNFTSKILIRYYSDSEQKDSNLLDSILPIYESLLANKDKVYELLRQALLKDNRKKQNSPPVQLDLFEEKIRKLWKKIF